MPLLAYSITTAAAGAVVAVFALAVAVLRACNHPLIGLFYDRSGQKIETGETWSIFYVLN